MKKFFESNSFSLVVGMFEKYGSTEKVAVNFCNKLYEGKDKDLSYTHKIISNYNNRIDGRALISAIAYLSIFEEKCPYLYKVMDNEILKNWISVFYWYYNENSFKCSLGKIKHEDLDDNYRYVEKGIGKLLKWGELIISQDIFDSSIFHICINPNKKLVDTSKAFEIYNSIYGEIALFGAVERNEITLEEASRVIGAEIVKGNLDLMRVC